MRISDWSSDVCSSDLRDVAGLAATARRLRAKLAVIGDEGFYQPLKEALAGSGVEAAAGQGAVEEAASRPVDWTMSAIVGSAGLKPTMAAIKAGATIAIANKESLVCAGPVVTSAAARHGVRLLPVDSEHHAIFQCRSEEHKSELKSLKRISYAVFCLK